MIFIVAGAVALYLLSALIVGGFLTLLDSLGGGAMDQRTPKALIVCYSLCWPIVLAVMGTYMAFTAAKGFLERFFPEKDDV